MRKMRKSIILNKLLIIEYPVLLILLVFVKTGRYFIHTFVTEHTGRERSSVSDPEELGQSNWVPFIPIGDTPIQYKHSTSITE